MTPQFIENRLKEAFPGADVLVSDMTGTGNHFEVRIIAPQFEALNRIKQHQAVMSIFDPELKSGELHALSLKTMAK
ncbi:MAG: BolA/IbaG family iron-sulfur metabolism protein [Bdellovibrionales bacterium]|nr:BolA/IbaG family iron-sulfur metabolism protein [Bdellovibrionales bacterium]